jgi:hypothetical protein
MPLTPELAFAWGGSSVLAAGRTLPRALTAFVDGAAWALTVPNKAAALSEMTMPALRRSNLFIVASCVGTTVKVERAALD